MREARTFARRAFQLAPQFQHDDLARDVAVYVMKMNADEAIELLMSDRDLFEVDREFRKKVGYHYSDEGWLNRKLKHFRKWDVTWQDAMIDVGLYIVATTLPILILIIMSAGQLASSYALMSVGGTRGQAALINEYLSTTEGAITLGFLLLSVLLGGAPKSVGCPR